MEFEIIRIIAKKEQIRVVKNIFEKFESHLKNIKMGKKKIGQLSDRAIVSVQVPLKIYEQIVEILIVNGLKVAASSDRSKVIIDEIKWRLSRGMDDEELEKQKETIKLNNLPVSDEELDRLAREGNYQEIKKLSKDIVNFSENFIKQIGDLLTIAVGNAINEAVLVSKKDSETGKSSVHKLLEIASDVTLRSFHKKNIMVEAGMNAVEICLASLELMSLLVDIANNSHIPNSVNLRAAVRYAEIVLEDKDFFAKDLEYAVRHLNTRWLLIAYDTAKTTLTSEELAIFKNLIDYINSKKQN